MTELLTEHAAAALLTSGPFDKSLPEGIRIVSCLTELAELVFPADAEHGEVDKEYLCGKRNTGSSALASGFVETRGHVQEISMKTATKRQNVPSSKVPNGHASIKGLTPHQKGIFQRIDAIEGNDADARRQVEKILRELSGEKVTKALAGAAKKVLFDREWGVKCVCDQPAALLWMIAPRCVEGGQLCFSHHTKGKRCIHGGKTFFPELKIVAKPDLRFR